MVVTKTRWLAAATAALALGSGNGCSAGGGGDSQISPTQSGGTGGGGRSSLGGQNNTGGAMLLTGGTGSGALPKGRVRGTLRDLPAGFPDYRPRIDFVMGDASGIVDQSRGVAYTKDQDNHDVDIVGALGAPLGTDGKPIYAGHPVDGTITTWGSAHPGCNGQPCFNYWFRDDPNQNQRMELELQLVEDPAEPGKWIFDNNGQMWFPIDDQLFGNDDSDYPEHNYGFTFELTLEFRYVQGQVFRFIGDDDVFVYINGFLVVNLGGIHGPLEGTCYLDEWSLTPGNDYTLHFFFAERNPTFSNFRIETTIAPDDWVIY